MARKIIKSLFGYFGYNIASNKSSFYHWQKDKEFISLYESIRQNTLVLIDRCYVIYQFAVWTNKLEGDIAEVGVYKGGTGRLLASVCKNKDIYLFDSFEGFKETNIEKGIDNYNAGDFGDISHKEVSDFLSGCKNIKIIKGWFPESASDIASNFSLIHLDVDLYQSTKDGLEFFWPKLSNGGVIIIDDYHGKQTPGVKKATDEFCQKHDIQPFFFAANQCVLIKVF